MLESLAGKRVLVTGATGFIGSHLARRLISEGAEVHVFLRKSSRVFRIQDIIGNLAMWHGDVADYQAVRFCVRGSSPQIVFHLAALRNVMREMSMVDAVIETNIRGTANLLTALKEEQVSLNCFVNAGSSEEYGDGSVPFYEDQREIPVSPYSASKVAATYFCQMLHKSLGIPIVTLRPFLAYGPDQDADMFVPSLIKHCLNKKDFPMTSGDQTRDFIYIDDVIEAFLLAAVSPLAIGEIINVGGGIEYTIKEVAEKITRMMGNSIKLLVGSLQKRPGEAKRFFCNNEKAIQLLEWVPRIALDEGLRKTIQRYRNIPCRDAETLCNENN